MAAMAPPTRNNTTDRQPHANHMMGIPDRDRNSDAAQRPVQHQPQILIAEFHLFLTMRQNDAEDLHKACHRAGDQAQQC